ncbi:MAG: hypothetical protein ABI363_02165 [Nitrosospira sp.]
MTSATEENTIAKEFLDKEIVRIKYLDSLLLNDVKRIKSGKRMLYMPLILLAVLIALAKLTDWIDSDNSEIILIFLFFILLLVVIPTKIRIHRNLKLFNESKAKLESAGLYLWRRKERNLINPANDLIVTASNELDSKSRFTLIPPQIIDFDNYKKDLWWDI